MIELIIIAISSNLISDHGYGLLHDCSDCRYTVLNEVRNIRGPL